MQVVSINCSLNTLEVGPSRLEANSDIAGVGVCIITITFSSCVWTLKLNRFSLDLCFLQ